jgi:hypothetical protein
VSDEKYKKERTGIGGVKSREGEERRVEEMRASKDLKHCEANSSRVNPRQNNTPATGKQTQRDRHGDIAQQS